MDTAQAMGRLTAYQARIEVILAGARAALNVPAPDAGALAAIRWELLRVLREYQLFKHGEIFDPLLRSPVPERQARAKALKDACLAVAETYTAHVQRWTLAGANIADPAYVQDAWTMAWRLSAYLPKERMEISELLLGVERTRRG